MNKNDKIIVGVLFAALLGWIFFVQPRMQKEQQDAAARARAESLVELGSNAVSVASNTVPELRAAPSPSAVAAAPEVEPPAGAAPAVVATPAHIEPEKRIALSNDMATITISSWGGGVVNAEFKDYRQSLDKKSPPIQFDFSDKPALTLLDIPELSVGHDFQISGDDSTVVVERVTSLGLHFTRTICLTNSYSLVVVDTFDNKGKEPVSLQRTGITMGAMGMLQSKASLGNVSLLGLDVMPSDGANVLLLGEERLPGLFGTKTSAFGCSSQDATHMRVEVSEVVTQPLDWGAVNNKYFTQILLPEKETGAVACRLYARRDTNSTTYALAAVSMDLICEGKVLQPGDTLSRQISYYVGPKKYDHLKDLGSHQDKVMLYAYSGWGWFRRVCVACLWTLNKIHEYIPNYGVAIILLTMMVRLVFWPVTRKSAESMRKMQAIQPLMKELQAKHKGNPQKLQQETMALYKKHKVNPMASCLPMLVQMPVFIALFIVLRSAVELRFAPFLWVSDLSEPEGLFEGVVSQIPVIGSVIGSLNILPLFMTLTTWFQQKITPTAGDPQQQKMMMLMPFFMLFFFYSMPSALVLYWSVSQVLAICGILWGNWWKKRQAAAVA